jgi:polyhydroxyalkanoate synthesis regulator phasin
MSERETPETDWPSNYFNYFTEIEEHFQRARGTSLFLLSPLDWALIENWKTAGIPLEAVLKGIDEAFEKWRSRKVKRRNVNSVAYCAQAVMEAAQRAPGTGKRGQSEAPFSVDDLRGHLTKAANALRANANSALHDVAATLESLASDAESQIQQLEDLERRLTSLEDRIVAILRAAQTEEDLYAIRQALDRELSPYRGKMTAEQLSMLERRYLDTAVLERGRVPRLSLFYLY